MRAVMKNEDHAWQHRAAAEYYWKAACIYQAEKQSSDQGDKSKYEIGTPNRNTKRLGQVTVDLLQRWKDKQVTAHF